MTHVLSNWLLIYLIGQLLRRRFTIFQSFPSRFNPLFYIFSFLSSFPGATNETLLQKFNSVNKDNEYYEVPQKREAAFIVRHYAGKVKYQSNEFREKNLDLMKADIVAVLKSSQYAFVACLFRLYRFRKTTSWSVNYNSMALMFHSLFLYVSRYFRVKFVRSGEFVLRKRQMQ